MRSTPLLIEARPVGGQVVKVRFEDGTVAEVDLSYLLEYGGVFEPLRDPAYFGRLRADREAGTIVWPNNADIAPETLYALARPHWTEGKAMERRVRDSQADPGLGRLLDQVQPDTIGDL